MAFLYSGPNFNFPQIKELFEPVRVKTLSAGVLCYMPVQGRQLPSAYQQLFSDGIDQVFGFTPATLHNVVDGSNIDELNSAIITTASGESQNLPSNENFGPTVVYQLSDYPTLARIAMEKPYPIMLYDEVLKNPQDYHLRPVIDLTEPTSVDHRHI